MAMLKLENGLKIFNLTGITKRTREELNILESVARCAIKTDERWVEAYNYYLKNKSIRKTSKYFKVSEGTLSKNFKRLNLPIVEADFYIYKKYKQEIKYSRNILELNKTVNFKGVFV